MKKIFSIVSLFVIMLVLALNASASTVSFSITEGTRYLQSQLSAVTITAAGSSKVELYINGTLKGTKNSAPFTFDLSSEPIGKKTLVAKAYDSQGAVSEATLNITIYERSTASIYSSDFSDYIAAGVPKSNYTSGDVKSGYIKPGVVDSGHGNSLFIGMNSALSTGSFPYVDFISGNSSIGVFTMETDFYMSTYTNAFLYLNGGGYCDVIIRQNGTITCSSNGTTKASVNYTAGKWQHYKYVVDIPNGKYSFYFGNDKDSMSAVVENSPLTTGITSYTKFRVAIDFKLVGYIALDNLQLGQVIDSPLISSLSASSMTDGKINYGQKNFVITMDKAISSLQLNKLTINNGVSVANAVYSSGSPTITLSLDSELMSNTTYTITIDGGIIDTNKCTFSGKQTYCFTTPMAPLELIDAVAENGEFKGTVVNSSSEIKYVYLFITTWDGNQIKSVNCYKKEINAKSQINLNEELPSGGKVEVYVWDSLSSPKVVSQRIFEIGS